MCSRDKIQKRSQLSNAILYATKLFRCCLCCKSNTVSNVNNIFACIDIDQSETNKMIKDYDEHEQKNMNEKNGCICDDKLDFNKLDVT